ncbi:MAG: EAL domain-containing protein, partial [Frankia sp.]|nr:EAL domain-containing protein [Frankia sp.]
MLDAGLIMLGAAFLIPVLADLHKRYAVTHFPWWALAVLFLATDVYALDVPIRRQHQTYTLTELALVVGLFFCSPADLLLARGASTLASMGFWRRQEPTKLFFNVCQNFVVVAGSLFVVRLALGETARPGLPLWSVAYLVACGASLASAHTVSLAIRLFEGRLPQSHARWNRIAALISGVVQATLALLVVGLVWDDTANVWLLGALALIMFAFFRAYAALVERHNSTELLYEFTRVGDGSPTEDEVLRAVVLQARDLMRAERAEITWLATDRAAGATVLRVGADGDVTRGREDVESMAALAARYGLSDQGSIVLPRNVRTATSRQQLTDHGVRDAAVVALHGEQGVSGVLMVADRLGGVRTFGTAELRLLESLASHASVSLQNARLIDRLTHDVTHDRLTGLSNRTRFQEEVDAGIAATAPGAGLAVLLLDLDGFKEINDTLGHDNGDRLLRDVGARLLTGLQPGQRLARFGGDEFVILLPDVVDSEDAIARARLIQAALETPYPLGELSLELRATTGVAMFPAHGADGATLLQRAEVAMYYAKAAATGVELYAPARDDYSPRRLALVSELRRAIDQGELVVHYQPKFDLSSGMVTGAEALVRWEHPRDGLLSPDQFVPVAEHTGLVRPLSMHVLEAALDECRVWRVRGHMIGVAVNLSVRNLLDLDLPNKVRELLRSAGVPPVELTIELTESSVMSDPERVIEVLNRLNALGVRLSVDDFGTGYSSLSYLKRLPVHEMKIDRSFV